MRNQKITRVHISNNNVSPDPTIFLILYQLITILIPSWVPASTQQRSPPPNKDRQLQHHSFIPTPKTRTFALNRFLRLDAIKHDQFAPKHIRQDLADSPCWKTPTKSQRFQRYLHFYTHTLLAPRPHPKHARPTTFVTAEYIQKPLSPFDTDRPPTQSWQLSAQSHSKYIRETTATIPTHSQTTRIQIHRLSARNSRIQQFLSKQTFNMQANTTS